MHRGGVWEEARISDLVILRGAVQGSLLPRMSDLDLVILGANTASYRRKEKET